MSKPAKTTAHLNRATRFHSNKLTTNTQVLGYGAA